MQAYYGVYTTRGESPREIRWPQAAARISDSAEVHLVRRNRHVTWALGHFGTAFPFWIRKFDSVTVRPAICFRKTCTSWLRSSFHTPRAARSAAPETDGDRIRRSNQVCTPECIPHCILHTAHQQLIDVAHTQRAASLFRNPPPPPTGPPRFDGLPKGQGGLRSLEERKLMIRSA